MRHFKVKLEVDVTVNSDGCTQQCIDKYFEDMFSGKKSTMIDVGDAKHCVPSLVFVSRREVSSVRLGE